MREHEIISPARAIMPTHVHFVLPAFPDQPREQPVQLLKGASSRGFFRRHPILREELGSHLWQKGYQWVPITGSRQLVATIRYVKENRLKVGLPPIPGPEGADVVG